VKSLPFAASQARVGDVAGNLETIVGTGNGLRDPECFAYIRVDDYANPAVIVALESVDVITRSHWLFSWALRVTTDQVRLSQRYHFLRP
jgi:hypothetical protein